MSQWFPRLMTRAELEQEPSSKEDYTMDRNLQRIWEQFAYRLGAAQGTLALMVEDDRAKDFFSKKGTDLGKAQKLLESMRQMAECYYRDELRNSAGLKS